MKKMMKKKKMKRKKKTEKPKNAPIMSLESGM